MVVYTVIVIALTLSGIVIFFLTKTSLGLKFKYPKTACDIFEDEYQVNSSTHIAENANIWASDSVKEWNSNIRNETDTRPIHFAGIMQCFCANQKKLHSENLKFKKKKKVYKRLYWSGMQTVV